MTLRLAALLAVAALASACARNEPPMANSDLGQPIYAKDGMTVVGYSNDMNNDGLADDSDDFDGN